jgi:hypothetical protein
MCIVKRVKAKKRKGAVKGLVAKNADGTRDENDFHIFQIQNVSHRHRAAGCAQTDEGLNHGLNQALMGRRKAAGLLLPSCVLEALCARTPAQASLLAQLGPIRVSLAVIVLRRVAVHLGVSPPQQA